MPRNNQKQKEKHNIENSVLFVEDDYMTIEPIVDALRLKGWNVDVESSALDGVNSLSSRAFRCIFLDVMLPCGEVFSLEESADGRYTGLRLLEALRREEHLARNRATRVCLITNWREEPQVDHVASMCDALILRKPLSIAGVEEVLRG